MGVERRQDFVTAAVVAAHIHAATKHAQDMALVAKNARAVALRAGDLALGFKPITNFIETIAEQTMISAREVNHLSINMAKIAVSYSRLTSFHTRLSDARRRCAEQKLSPFLEKKYQDTGGEIDELAQTSQRALNALRQQLDNAIQDIRAASVVATAARVEAARADTSKDQLDHIAVSIDNAANAIKTDLGKALRILD